MPGFIRNVPLFLYLFLFYNLLVGLTYYYSPGSNILDITIRKILLPSGAYWRLSIRDVFIFMGIFSLYFEIFKSTRASDRQILEHTLSFAVFLAFLLEFIFLPHVADSSFLLLGCMSCLDLISGYTISISAARRDLMLR